MAACVLAANAGTLTTLQFWHIAVGLIGGLALFLYGIEKMSDGLRAVAGDGLKTLLGKLTANRFSGVLTGAAVTAVIQSSSLTTVLVVGFISAGLMTLQQSVGVIMGANIGTTLTVQVAAFKVTQSAWLLVALGFAAIALGRRDSARQLGSVLIGLGLLFLALEQMSAATSPLRSYPPFLNLMQRLENPILGILVGAVFTALVQSSTATTGVVLALASQGLMQLPAALAMALGANLGSCATALIAGLGKPAEARQAAVVHLIFNVVGVLLWGFFLPQLGVLVQWLSDDLPRQFANAHTIFNITNTAILIWFAGPMAQAAQFLVPRKTLHGGPSDANTPKYLDDTLLETPSLALDRVGLELGHMGDLVLGMFEKAGPAVLSGSRSELENIAALDKGVNQLYVATVEYTRRLAREEMSLAETGSLEDCLAAVNYLESAGDVIASNLVTQGLRRLEHNLTISTPTQEVLRGLHLFVAEALQSAVKTVRERDSSLARRVVAGKDEFNKLAQAALEQLRRRLMADEPARALTFQMEVDLVAQYQRLHYLARRLAKLVVPASDQEA